MSNWVDLNYFGTNKDDNILTSPLDLFMQEIFLAVQTGPHQIWGLSDSIDISRYVFNKFVSITQIRNEISTFISRNCAHASQFNYVVSTEIINNNGKELIYIVVTVNVPTDNKHAKESEYVQKFLLGH